MRILQIVPSISLIYGGPSQMVLGLSEALAGQGAQVTIVTTDANGDSGQAPLAVPIDHPIDQDGYRIRYFRCWPFQRYKFSPALLIWLARHAHEYDVAHIHALFSPLSTAAATVCRWAGLPYVLRPLGTLDPLDLRKKARRKRLYGRWLERPNLAGAGAVHFTSREEARISERFGARTIDWVVPLGVQLPPLPPNYVPPDRQDSDPPRLLYLSRFDPKKGLELAIEALEQLAAAGVAFRLVLAGSNPQDPVYEQQILDRARALNRQLKARDPDRYGVGRDSAGGDPAGHDPIEIVGFVTGDRKRQLLAESDLFLLPSYYENFGIAAAEAMAAGIPVMISRGVHIWPEVAAAEAGWVCDCTVESVTETLRLALSDRSEARRRAANAAAYARENYAWPTIAAHLLDLYGNLKRP